ncbi:hypothetical protein BC828DRAFT_394631 [Blastocladiella britannica]|nr:hypothetical protein BC828DRAFT_394631 [Blastocladiella britannica]
MRSFTILSVLATIASVTVQSAHAAYEVIAEKPTIKHIHHPRHGKLTKVVHARHTVIIHPTKGAIMTNIAKGHKIVHDPKHGPFIVKKRRAAASYEDDDEEAYGDASVADDYEAQGKPWAAVNKPTAKTIDHPKYGKVTTLVHSRFTVILHPIKGAIITDIAKGFKVIDVPGFGNKIVRLDGSAPSYGDDEAYGMFPFVWLAQGKFIYI